MLPARVQRADKRGEKFKTPMDHKSVSPKTHQLYKFHTGTTWVIMLSKRNIFPVL